MHTHGVPLPWRASPRRWRVYLAGALVAAGGALMQLLLGLS